MTPVERHTVCQTCGARHNLAAFVAGPTEGPADGDVTLCVTCGGVAFFDSTREGGLRATSHEELRKLEESPGFVLAREAVWVRILRESRASAGMPVPDSQESARPVRAEMH